MRQILEELVDRTKVQKGDVDVLIVGGGAMLIDDDEPLSGIRTARKVKGGEFANAVGAPIPQASGVVDTVLDTSQQTLKEGQAKVSHMAIEAAVINGAQRGTVSIAEVKILPIQYADKKARMVIRAIGILDAVQPSQTEHVSEDALPETLQERLGQTLDATDVCSEAIEVIDAQSY